MTVVTGLKLTAELAYMQDHVVGEVLIINYTLVI